MRELEQHVLGRKLLLIGYSYGGILAYCLAAKLLNKGFDIDLMMIEPALPYRDLPWKIRLRQRLGSLYRLLFSRTPVGQVAAKGGEAEMISSEASIAEQRWNFMHPHYVQNIDSAFLHALGQRVALVAGAAYHASYAACWHRIETGGIESCVLPRPTITCRAFRSRDSAAGSTSSKTGIAAATAPLVRSFRRRPHLSSTVTFSRPPVKRNGDW